MTGIQRVALVTAATSSLGRGMAEALLADGFLVVVSGRSEAKGLQAAAEMDPSGRVSFVACDALDQGQTEAMVDTVIERHGRIDVLINNAGGSSGFAPVHQLSDDAWAQAFQWNVSSAFWAVRRAVPAMLEQGFGRIINISSVQGKQANRPNASHYVTAKHALNGFTKAVALEYGRQGITSNAICVGAVETDLMQDAGRKAAAAAGISYEAYKQRYADAAMTGRLNSVGEVAAMARLLASEAGAGITGAILNVDGGTCSY
ncbi:SDR family NAD(P)-dependent oxidoreductase (plasmid) [Sphingobium sp. SJ10-10]|uniref:SDR family NAD(P)-dependent oxidoreductase n=1 Tax=unclassified Sphingobium TaxID=2611147 RepID=UPI000B3C0805|nr:MULTISPECIES: SDR family NAD(P)-dependent oxidoreductase [Sphingomonadaceae]MEC6702136.1 SDR family NAD(P)-dependent oxidoreductase [Sphingobium sp. SJ10-10]NML90633.1 SDR family oxidoreductase [Sphingobium sp. TB-6]